MKSVVGYRRAVGTCALLAVTLFFFGRGRAPSEASPAQSATPTTVREAPEAASTDYSRGGPVHDRAIALWRETVRPLVTEQLKDGLAQDGDVYVLYYIQEYLQSFVEMTRRCRDLQQIDELAETLNLAFEALRPLPDDPAARGWICTGGSICTPASGRLGKEVRLVSVQFLGLLGAVATNIVENVPAAERSRNETLFLENTWNAMVGHLDRWLTPSYFAHVDSRISRNPKDVVGPESRYYFSDFDLWMMTVLSDLSELSQAGEPATSKGDAIFLKLTSRSDKIAGMFDLFLKRVTLTDAPDGPRAELDRGYWTYHADNRYALYQGAESPVVCEKNERGQRVPVVRLPAKPSFLDPNVGWDISHSRRLVPALETFARNKDNIAKVFHYDNPKFDPVSLRRAFANQIASKIWNEDENFPLFSNYWDGENGWYRVAYDNGTGQCRPGNPPFGLASAFATGGYPLWGEVNATVRELGERVHQLLDDDRPEAGRFMKKYYYYVGGTAAAPSTLQKVWRLSLLSDLVGSR